MVGTPRIGCATRAVALAGALSVTLSGFAMAEYPDRPIRLIVPSVPGGGTDLTFRMVEPKLSEILGQKLVLDNRGGAGGDIGAAAVARAEPDGYTLLAVIASHTINPAFKKDIPYSLERDFVPISLVVKAPNVLVSNPGLPAKTLAELIAYAKAQPHPLEFASAGVGSMPHLMMELFLHMSGLKMVHVAYKGTGQASTDVIAGHVPLMTGNILPTLPFITSGQLRAYGVTSAERSAAAPDIPTLSEAGVSGYEAVQWFGLMAPAGTPPEIVAKLHAAVTKALADPALKKRMVEDGADPTASRTPEAFGAFIRSETAKWAKVILDGGIVMKQ